MFQSINYWPIKAGADPLRGWSAKDVEETSSGAARADLYGKLFYHLRATIGAFLDRVGCSPVLVRVCSMETIILPEHIERETLLAGLM